METFVPLIYYITDHAPDTAYFSNVMNFHLTEPLLHFLQNSAVNWVQIWTVGSHTDW